MRLIDADALQKALAERWYEAPARLSGIKVSMLIDEQPTIEPKRGRWITRGDCIYCSECRKSRWSRTPFEDLVKHFNYCPNCGAKMRE